MTIICRWSLAACLSAFSAGLAADYSTTAAGKAFIDEMVSAHGFARAELTQVLAQAEKQQAILDAIARPAEKTKPWFEYRQIFLGSERIEQGVAFWQENAEVLQKVSDQYAVEPEIIVAIIGVETRYGKHMGSYRVLDALATLGFDYPPRSSFFRKELGQYLLLAREQKKDPAELYGSYAGAMGYGQFIPSSYRHYARDFDGDGRVDIWQNKPDAIASVANYFKVHGWQKGQPVFAATALAKLTSGEKLYSGERPTQTVAAWRASGVTPAETPDGTAPAVLLEYQTAEGAEYLLGFNNFYVITRYNRSQLYARAVWDLAQAIKQQKNAKTQ